MINCAGLSYLQLKSQVENLVVKNYPLGGVQFVLASPAVFTVTVTGEVGTTTEHYVWALTRLSEVLTSNLTSYSSRRKITVESSSGKSKTYDLFLADRDGDMSQDPYLRPRDKIVVGRYNRKVSVYGAVERPGTYELLEGENLKELVTKYANGLSEYADTNNIVLQRKINSTSFSGDTIYLASNAITENTALENADVINIPSRRNMSEVMFFEGAVGALAGGMISVTGEVTAVNNSNLSVKTGTNTSTTKDIDKEKEKEINTTSFLTDTKEIENPVINRIPVQYLEGENLATLVRRASNCFVSMSDLRSAYIVRNGERFPVNLEKCLYDSRYMSDYIVMRDDVLYVPYMQTTSMILLTGEVKKTLEVNAWPLQRLSTIIKSNLTDYSSSRDIEVIGIDGTKKIYDLFKADRYGQMDQNPYIRPGETVKLNRISRVVTVKGAVERPGTYELLEGENLKDLVETYGNGLEPLADTSRIELYRKLSDNNSAGKKIYLSQEDLDNNTELLCYDEVTVSSYMDLQPVVFVEGALKISDSDTGLSGTTKITATFTEGEDYAFFVRRNRDWFSAESDLDKAYIIRGEEIISMDLNPMLNDSSYYSNIKLESNDRMIVPFRQFFVSVAGAVINPGRYPYIPDRKWDYYVGLAGGFVKTANAGESVTIQDVDGNKYSKRMDITPETTITANTNSPLYYFNQYVPVITTILSLISSTISILAITGVLK